MTKIIYRQDKQITKELENEKADVLLGNGEAMRIKKGAYTVPAGFEGTHKIIFRQDNQEIRLLPNEEADRLIAEGKAIDYTLSDLSPIGEDIEDRIDSIEVEQNTQNTRLDTAEFNIDTLFSLVGANDKNTILKVKSDVSQIIEENDNDAIIYNEVEIDELGMTDTPPATNFTIPQELIDEDDLLVFNINLQSDEDDAEVIIRGWNITKDIQVGNNLNVFLKKKDVPQSVSLSIADYFEDANFDDTDDFEFRLEATRRQIEIVDVGIGIIEVKGVDVGEIIDRLDNLEKVVRWDIDLKEAIVKNPFNDGDGIQYINLNDEGTLRVKNSQNQNIYKLNKSGTPEDEEDIATKKYVDEAITNAIESLK